MRNLLAFPDDSRVWIYQADRPFTEEEIQQANADIDAFCRQWTSHNQALRAIGGIMHDLFVVLVADETMASASGCSIDKSVAFVKSLEQKYQRTLLERNIIAWLDDQEQLHVTPLSGLKEAIAKGNMTLDTRIFDNLVSTRKDYLARWVVPIRDSWVKRFV